MADGRESETIELEVEDFGPIVEAKLDLRPFTVFVGPSNTGKSYLAILIYALHRFFGGGSGPSDWFGPRGYGMFPNVRAERFSSDDRNAIANWAKRAWTLNEIEESPGTPPFVPPRRIFDEVRSGFSQHTSQIVDEVRRCFGAADQANLIRNGASPRAQVRFRGRDPSGAARPECELTIEAKSAAFDVTIPYDIQIQNAEYNKNKYEYFHQTLSSFLACVNEIYNPSPEYGKHIFNEFTGNLIDLASREVAVPLRLPVYYLPADRTGVMNAHAALVGAMIQSASRTGLRRTEPVPALSGVLADFLDRLIRIDQPDFSARRRQRDMSAGIEDAILDGAVRVERGAITGYPSFYYRPRGWKRDLPLMNASSMVSELAPVVLFLRHQVAAGDLLIVEEPESHLHPAKQVEFTRQLAQLVQAGVRVLITTHSEWVLDELANIVQRSYLPKEQRTEAVGGDVALRPDQVGAWLFGSKRRPKGSVVKEIKLKKGDRLPSDHDDVALALYNNWAEIVSRQENAE